MDFGSKDKLIVFLKTDRKGKKGKKKRKGQERKGSSKIKSQNDSVVFKL